MVNVAPRLKRMLTPALENYFFPTYKYPSRNDSIKSALVALRDCSQDMTSYCYKNM